MDITLAKSIIGRFDKNAFESFFQKLLNESDVYNRTVERLPEIDDRIFESPPERFYQSADAFFVHYAPYSIFSHFNFEKLNMSELRNLVSTY